MSKALVVILSNDEYDQLHKQAEDRGISASKYAYDKLSELLKGNEEKISFEDKWNLVLERLAAYPSNTQFDISLIVGIDDWKTYDRGTKLALARTLKRKVDDGTIGNVSIVGRSSSNVTIYRKN